MTSHVEACRLGDIRAPIGQLSGLACCSYWACEGSLLQSVLEGLRLLATASPTAFAVSGALTHVC